MHTPLHMHCRASFGCDASSGAPTGSPTLKSLKLPQQPLNQPQRQYSVHISRQSEGDSEGRVRIHGGTSDVDGEEVSEESEDKKRAHSVRALPKWGSTVWWVLGQHHLVGTGAAP